MKIDRSDKFDLCYYGASFILPAMVYSLIMMKVFTMFKIVPQIIGCCVSTVFIIILGYSTQ